MNLKKVSIPLAMVMVVLPAFLAAPVCAADPPPSKLAVVSISRLFNALDAKKAGDAVIESLGKDLTAKRQKLEDDRNKLDADLANYKPDSDIYKETSEKLLKAAMDAEAYPQYIQQRLLLETRVKTADLYRQMNKAIEDYARSQGVALVLAIDEADLSKARSQSDVLSLITIRKVIYAHESLDITKAIIEKMNAEYRSTQGK